MKYRNPQPVPSKPRALDGVEERPETLTIIFGGDHHPEVVTFRDRMRHAELLLIVPWNRNEPPKVANCWLEPKALLWMDENLSPETEVTPGYDILYVRFTSERDYVLFKTFWL